MCLLPTVTVDLRPSAGSNRDLTHARRTVRKRRTQREAAWGKDLRRVGFTDGPLARVHVAVGGCAALKRQETMNLLPLVRPFVFEHEHCVGAPRGEARHWPHSCASSRPDPVRRDRVIQL